ncbi:MAG: hypothetical protein ACLRMJ_09970 [Alistipes finegoldii]
MFSIRTRTGDRFRLHLENGSIRRAATLLPIWGGTQIKASTATPSEVPVGSRRCFTGRLHRVPQAEQGSWRPADRVTYMERCRRQRYVRSLQWPNKLIGNISTGTIVWEQDFILYRHAQYYPLAELRYHRKDYSGALTAQCAGAALRQSSFYTDSRPQPSGRRSWTRTQGVRRGQLYFTLIRHQGDPAGTSYRYGRRAGQWHRHVAPQPTADARVEEGDEQEQQDHADTGLVVTVYCLMKKRLIMKTLRILYTAALPQPALAGCYIDRYRR